MKLTRAVLAGVTLAASLFVAAPDAEAGRFFFRARKATSSPRGVYRVRGVSPLTIHVSRARYKRLTTFYPTIVKPR